MLRISLMVVAGLMASGSVMQAVATERIEAVENSRAQVRPSAGQLELTVTDGDAVRFEIYSITGQQVKSLEVKDGSITVDLPSGCYVVRCQYWSKKVVVK